MDRIRFLSRSTSRYATSLIRRATRIMSQASKTTAGVRAKLAAQSALFKPSTRVHTMKQPSIVTCSLTAIAAAVSIGIAACSANDSPNLALTASGDDPDSATSAQVADILSSVDASIRVQYSGDNDAAPEPGVTIDHSQSQSARRGRFPGLVQTNLVANNDDFGAQIVEPELRNAWGIAIRPAGAGGHFWVGAAETGKSIQYVGDVDGTPLFQDELKIVDTRGPVSGVAFNHGPQFMITQPHENGEITNPSKFFFANLSGSITAWTERARPDGGFDHPTDAVVVVDGSARRSAYFGVTVAPAGDRMFAADFGAQAALRVFDGQFNEHAALANPFDAGNGPEFAAFNVQTLDQRVFAMYGRHVAPDTQPRPTDGRLAEFDGNGQFVARWHGRGLLNYPWGIAQAPKDFGLYSGCLLVGNFGDGTMVAFHPRLKVALDYVRDDRGERVRIDGLWGLQFGNGASLGTANHLYFAAGPNKEQDGLFGKLQANPRTLPPLRRLSMCH